MAMIDNLKERDDMEQKLSRDEHLASELASFSQQIAEQAKAITGLIGELKTMEDVNDARLDRLAAELLRSVDRANVPNADTQNQLKEIKSELRSIASSVKNNTKMLKLPNGQTLSRADFTAYSLTQQINQELQNLAQNSADQATAVRELGTVHVDTTGIADYAAKDLDARLSAAVEKPTQRIEATLNEFEHRVAKIGAERLDEVTAKAEAVIRSVSDAEHRVDKLARVVTWSTLGKICQALVPFAIAFIILGGLVWWVRADARARTDP